MIAIGPTSQISITRDDAIRNAASALSDVYERFQALEILVVGNQLFDEKETKHSRVYQDFDYISQSVEELTQFLFSLSEQADDGDLSVTLGLIESVKLEDLRIKLKAGSVQDASSVSNMESIQLFE